MKLTPSKKVTSLIISSFIALSLISTPTSANAASPKAGTKCTMSGQKVTSNNLTFTCTKSGKNLVWSIGVKDNGSKSAQASSGGSSVTEGFLCDPGKAMTGKSSAGVTLTCVKGQDGKSSWRQASQGGGNGAGQGKGDGQSQSSAASGNQLGSSCSKEGELGWNGFVVAICKSGKVRYALSADFPKTPNGGYTSRPSWYPTLTQIMSGGNSVEPKCSPSSIKFSKPVVPLDKMAPSIPYGMMVAGHVTPIDHAYLGITSLSKSKSERTESDWVSVTAPGDGTITELSTLGAPDTNRVTINHGCNLYSVYMVLNKPSGVLAKYVDELAAKGSINLNLKVKAGDEFGRQRDNMLDFNVFDGTQWLSGFANPVAYLTQDAWKPYTADFCHFSPMIFAVV